MARCINDCEAVLGCFEFLKGNVNGDASFSFGFEIVENPGIFIGTFAHFRGFFFVLFKSRMVDAAELIQQVASRR